MNTELPLEGDEREVAFLADLVPPNDVWGERKDAGQWLTTKLIDGFLQLHSSSVESTVVYLSEDEAAHIHTYLKRYSKDENGKSFQELWLRLLTLRHEFRGESFVGMPEVEAIAEEPEVDEKKLKTWKERRRRRATAKRTDKGKAGNAGKAAG